jgi:HTH-type transcriptional regulator, transcriptional repressor of NAD biosynthesis genes
MKRGLVIGKFMPVHQGHMALIRFALTHCDELIVSMSFTMADPIPHSLRFDWLKKIFEQEPKIKIEESLDDFDNETLPLIDRTKIWARFIEKRFPKIDVVISSEEYGVPFADHLGASCVLFDQSRIQIPISATKIRTKPFLYWQYIPEVVRPYFVKKICLYGPESTGKSVIGQSNG